MRNHETDCSGCIETKMGQKGVQIRFFRPRKTAKKTVPMFFPHPLRTRQRRRIAVFRHQMEGNVRHDGQSCGRIKFFFVIPGN